MKIFSAKDGGLRALNRILLNTDAVHEHTAINVTMSLLQDAAALEMLGHKIMLEVPDTAIFLEHPSGMRIELIPQGVTGHEAWVLPTREQWAEVNQRLMDAAGFESAPKEVIREDLLAKMFRHVPSGGVIQIVWRLNPIYADLFAS